MQLAEAALLVVAEDDAIASHSTVPFPVEPYLERIQKLADEFCRQRLLPLLSGGGGGGGTVAGLEGGQKGEPSTTEAGSIAASPSHEAILAELDDFLFGAQRITVPAFGRSNLPPGALVDHPGVWEDAR